MTRNTRSAATQSAAAGTAMNSTFVNGLSLLEALARSGEACGVSELARQLQLTKSNVHRLLQTLSERGFVRNPGAGGRYEMTLKLWELGVEVLNKLDVKSVALEHLEHLAQLIGETVHLSVLDHGEVVYIDKVDSPRPVRAYSKVGGRAPAHCVATGKALLAFAPASVVTDVLKRLRAYTTNSITDPAALRAELERVVEVGYAINRGEWREGVCGLAAPIRDSRGSVIAAIGISGPVERLKARTLKQLAPDVVQAARAVSTGLGWTPANGTQPS
jgi:DNA-binding IclR family transcriptional regulator